MKMIVSTLLALGVLAGAAHAETFNPFNDPVQALPRSEFKARRVVDDRDLYRAGVREKPEKPTSEYS